jgi:2-methylcitrate dehydratase PrpD
MMLGWSHYQQGWHPTCTAGALAAAVTAAVSVGLDSEQIATAICLAVPAAGGVQRSFGSSLKSLQVGFVAAAGTRAAELVAAGATTDLRVFDQWLGLMDPVSTQVDLTGPAVPGGIAIKLFPCCYALQRPISAALELLQSVEKPFTVRELRIATPESSLKPLIHHEPRNGLEAKFSLEYGVAAAILDGYPGLQSFTTEAVNRPAARDLMHRVHVSISPGGDGILAGRLDLELLTDEGRSYVTSLDLPPGSPDRPATPAQVQAKLSDCVGDVPDWMNTASWCGAAEALAQRYPGHLGAGVPSGLRR